MTCEKCRGHGYFDSLEHLCDCACGQDILSTLRHAFVNGEIMRFKGVPIDLEAYFKNTPLTPPPPARCAGCDGTGLDPRKRVVCHCPAGDTVIRNNLEILMRSGICELPHGVTLMLVPSTPGQVAFDCPEPPAPKLRRNILL